MKTVVAIVSSNSPLPILNNLLISTADDPLELLRSEPEKIYIAATDLEMGIRASISGQIIDGGAITIPAKKFANIVRELPQDSDVRISSTSNDRAVIECGTAKFKLAALPADEFPPLIDEKDDDKKNAFVSINANTLLTMIQQVSYAVSREETRHFLNGVHISLKGDQVKMAATDGKRLATATGSLTVPVIEEKQGIVPVKAIERLKDMLLSSAVVKICLEDTRITFDAGEITLVSRLIDGEYPDYERVIPKDSRTRIVMRTQQLLSIVRRVGTMANPKVPGLTIEAIGDVLKVKARTPEYGEGYEETKVKKEGDDITIGLNAKYLMDILNNTDNDEVVLSMSDPLKPVLMKPLGDDNYVCVIMPMRL